ncbi:DEAD-domain-containing protein [Dentipellis sp. KUC8613]|nr:DEAD-domain-containing protein [Dentipellis sp. KUC8613]
MTIEIAEKKGKKSKKDAVAEPAAVDAGETKKEKRKRKSDDADASGAVVDEDKAERKRRKKEEKEKRKAEAAAAAAAGATDAGEAEADVDKSEKKKRKKEKKAKSGEADGEGESAGSPSDKKRKRTDTEEASAAEPSSSKKDKKQKSKKHRASEPEAASTSTSIPASSAATPSPSDISAYLAEHAITLSTPITPALSFAALQVPEGLRSAFAGFDKPTPVQACTWPPALEGRDVVGIAETGSGKTLAFGIPALSRLMSKSKKAKPQVRVLVVAPTRELALQTHDTLTALGGPAGINCVAVFGGVDKGAQIRALKNAHIVVGTPGRILDLVNDGACDLSQVSYLVLDEADRMLDRGFENDIRSIIGNTKQEGRQTLMFSATWPEAVRRLAGTFQKDPVRVTVGSDELTANSRVEQEVEVFENDREKDDRLMKHLRVLAPHKKRASDPEAERILVFVLYKKEATRVENTLRRSGYAVNGLHGDMSQNARLEALQGFRDGTTRLLVATDVAARGLDIPNVACVINYSFPLTIEDYIHRIGRTGRGGRSGKSITFFTGDKHERGLAGELARVLRDSGFECEELQKRFPMTIKKKTHSVYGAFFRDDVDMTAVPKKIVFDD